MAERSAIEWCDSTFNPWIGCTAISPACDHCYAEAHMSTRLGRVKWGAGQPRQRTSEANWRQPMRWNAQAQYFGQCDVCGHRGEKQFMTVSGGRKVRTAVCQSCKHGLIQPSRRRVFCASLADVFDNEVDPNWRIDLFDLIANTPNLDWLLLTKRIGNAADMINAALLDDGPRWPWPNVWLGATICNQPEADRDVIKLLRTPAAKRFVSVEPMLGPIRLWKLGALDFEEDSLGAEVYALSGTRAIPDCDWQGTKLDWVICGGESGPHARPVHPDWPRLLRDQCNAAGVPFMLKQWGEWAPAALESPLPAREARFIQRDGTDSTGHTIDEYTSVMVRIGKRAAGRLLDGVEHNGFPAP